MDVGTRWRMKRKRAGESWRDKELLKLLNRQHNNLENCNLCVRYDIDEVSNNKLDFPEDNWWNNNNNKKMKLQLLCVLQILNKNMAQGHIVGRRQESWGGMANGEFRIFGLYTLNLGNILGKTNNQFRFFDFILVFYYHFFNYVQRIIFHACECDTTSLFSDD